MTAPRATQHNKDIKDSAEWQVNVESRLAGLEVQVSSLASHLDNSLNSLAHRLEGMSNSLTDRIENISKSLQTVTTQKPAWGTYAAWAAVILAIVGLAGQGYIRDLTRIEANQDNIVNLAHENTNRFESMNQRILHNEYDVASISKEIETFEEWQLEHTKESAANFADNSARHDALSDRLKYHESQAGHPWDVLTEVKATQARVEMLTKRLDGLEDQHRRREQ